MKILNTLLSLTIVFMANSVDAQIVTPKPSPLAKSSQVFGLNEVSVEYSRPGVKGRKIFGELVPYGELWRTGANAATKFTFDSDVTVEGKELAAGEYSLFTIPGKDSWKVIFNKDASASTGSYDEALNALELSVKPSSTNEKVERLTISFNDITNNSVIVRIAWNKTKVEFKVETEVDGIVMGKIEDAMKGVKPRTYYDAGMYYFSTGKDLKQALEWVEKAIELEEEPAFWMLHNKAKIQAALGDYKDAVKTAQESLKLAKEANYAHYIYLNEEAIKEWTDKK